MKNSDIIRKNAGVKMESISEFLARGGKVTVCKASTTMRRQYKRKPQEELKEADLDALPDNVKIALGLKE